MDIKITKQRLDKHFEYDWTKYIIIVLVAVFFWLAVYAIADNPRSHETITFFVYSSKYNSDGEKIIMDAIHDDLKANGDETIRTVGASYYATIEQLSTTALVCDFFIGTQDTIDDMSLAFLPLSDEVLARAGVDKSDYELYYTYEDEEQTILSAQPRAVRIPPLHLEQWLPREITTDEGTQPQTYYIAIIAPNMMGSGGNLGELNSKEKYQQHDQAYRAFGFFLQYCRG